MIELRDNGFCENEPDYYVPLNKKEDEMKRFFESWGRLRLERIDLGKSDLHIELDGPLVEGSNPTFLIVVRSLRTAEGNVLSSHVLVQKAYMDMLDFSVFNGDSPVRLSLHGSWHTRDARCPEVKTEFTCQARADLQSPGLHTIYASVSPAINDRRPIGEFYVEPSLKRRK